MSEESRNVLIYLYCKNKGDWHKIYKDICDKVDIDTEKMGKILEDAASEGYSFITMLDDAYPEYLRKRVVRPPFVIRYVSKYGKQLLKTLKLVSDGHIKLTGVEDDKPTIEYLCQYPLFTATFGRDATSDSHIIITKGMDPTAKTEKAKKDATIQGDIICFDKIEAINIMSQICNQLLAVTCGPEFKLVIQNGAVNNCTIFACPGNSGCNCNKLIKGGAHLCDCWEDLKGEEPEESDLKEEEK